jgi:hypothetical protein
MVEQCFNSAHIKVRFFGDVPYKNTLKAKRTQLSVGKDRNI